MGARYAMMKLSTLQRQESDLATSHSNQNLPRDHSNRWINKESTQISSCQPPVAVPYTLWKQALLRRDLREACEGVNKRGLCLLT